jgi:hypothetical protein
MGCDVMANILDYMDWRGDLSFLQDQFNMIDNLILSKISYIDFEDAVPSYPSSKKVLFKNAVNHVFETHDKEKIVLGLIVPKSIITLTDLAKDKKRFGQIYVSNYVNIIEKKTKTQFSAMVFHLDEDTIYIAFRGTDVTLIGWQENIDMLYTCPVVSQNLAVEYVNKIADFFPEANIYLGGHSKGGNLANFATIYARSDVQDRIIHCYTNDGQGMDKNYIDMEKYERVKRRIVRIIPELDVVGMFFDFFAGRTIIVKSNAKGFYQHDGFSWQINVTNFELAKELAPKARKMDKALTKIIREVPKEDKIVLGKNVYDFILASQLDTLLDCKKESIRLLKYLNKFSGRSKKLFLQLVSEFLFF